MGKTSIVIGRPAAAVFARITDLERAREFAPQMGKFHIEGPLREGMTIRKERRLLGRTMNATWTITRLTQTTDVGLAGPLSVLSPLVAGEAQKEEDTELVRLKEILERE